MPIARWLKSLGVVAGIGSILKVLILAGVYLKGFTKRVSRGKGYCQTA